MPELCEVCEAERTQGQADKELGWDETPRAGPSSQTQKKGASTPDESQLAPSSSISPSGPSPASPPAAGPSALIRPAPSPPRTESSASVPLALATVPPAMIVPAPFITSDPRRTSEPWIIAAELPADDSGMSPEEARVWGLARIQAVLDRLHQETPPVPAPKPRPLTENSRGTNQNQPQGRWMDSGGEFGPLGGPSEAEPTAGGKKRLKRMKQKEKKRERAEKEKVESLLRKEEWERRQAREAQRIELDSARQSARLSGTGTGDGDGGGDGGGGEGGGGDSSGGSGGNGGSGNGARLQEEGGEGSRPPSAVRPVPHGLPQDADFDSPVAFQRGVMPPQPEIQETPALPTGSFQSPFTTPLGFTPSFLLGDTPSPYVSDVD